MDPWDCVNGSLALCERRTILFYAHCAGEVLGCTAPVIAQSADAIVFVADGRFHLEAIMIANPDIPAFRCATSFSLFSISLTISLFSLHFHLRLPCPPLCLLLLLPPILLLPRLPTAKLHTARWCINDLLIMHIGYFLSQLSSAQVLSPSCLNAVC